MHECNITMIGAAMTRLRTDTHYSIYEVREDCDDTVESFGRRHIPGFKSGSGYGYFEFTKPEYMKLNKNVILMDKVNHNHSNVILLIIVICSDYIQKGNLFTGAGAKFFYTGLKYDKDKS